MSPGAWSAIGLSVRVGLWCAGLGLAPAVALGWLLARKDFRLKPLVSAMIFVPLVLPPVVTGLLLLEAFGRNAPLGSGLAAIGLPVSFSLTGAVVAAFTVGLPFYVMAVRSAFESVDPRLEEVSWCLGETPWRTFRRVALPAALPGIAAGAVLAFARALGEFGATVVLAGNIEGETRTIALAVYSLLERPDGAGEAKALVAASLAVSLAALLGYEILNRWHRRRLELRDGR